MINREGERERERGGEGRRKDLDTGLIKLGMLIALALGKSFHPLRSLTTVHAFPAVSHAARGSPLAYVPRALACEQSGIREKTESAILPLLIKDEVFN